MAYLGPPPSQTPASPTSQYFSGNGSTTTFTLNRPVNVAEDLNVYVNNVAQQPGAGKSYTASGTNLISAKFPTLFSRRMTYRLCEQHPLLGPEF